MKRILFIIMLFLSLNCLAQSSDYINIGTYFSWLKTSINSLSVQISQLQNNIIQKIEIYNGTSTNQTLITPNLYDGSLYGNFYINGDTIIGAKGITNIITDTAQTFFSNYVKTISTKIINTTNTTISIYETNVIYKVSVNSPNSISNDLSNIVFDGITEKKWELWINYLTTNSLSTQWDNRMDFGGYVPDLTVTGEYKFVCSTVDGINIQTKQVYPIAYNSSPISIPYTGQVLVANNRYYGTITTPHTINIGTPFSTNKENNIILCAKFVGTNSVTWGTNLLLYNGQLPVASTNEVDIIYVWSNIQNKWKIGTLEAY